VPSLAAAAREAAAAAGVDELVVLGRAESATPILDLLDTSVRQVGQGLRITGGDTVAAVAAFSHRTGPTAACATAPTPP